MRGREININNIHTYIHVLAHIHIFTLVNNILFSPASAGFHRTGIEEAEADSNQHSKHCKLLCYQGILIENTFTNIRHFRFFFLFLWQNHYENVKTKYEYTWFQLIPSEFVWCCKIMMDSSCPLKAHYFILSELI